jgi:hypothetical protein
VGAHHGADIMMTLQLGASPDVRRNWRTLVWQIGLVVIGLWFVVVVVLESAPSIFGGGAAPAGASSTASDGYAAFVSLLRQRGDHVQTLSLGSSLSTPSTLVIAETALSSSQSQSAVRFVQAGGRLILIGDDEIETMRSLAGSDVYWSASSTTVAFATAAIPGGYAVHEVATDGAGSFTNVGGASVLVRSGSATLAAKIDVGRGQLTFIADPSVFANNHLAQDDNAALALDVVGAPKAAVTFAAISASAATGLASIPGPWKWALTLLAVAWGAWTWSRWRRLGPPDGDEDRPMAPARRTYIDSLSTLLARTHDPAPVGAQLQELVRARLARGSTTGLGAVVSAEESDTLGRKGSTAELLDKELDTEAELIQLVELAQRIEVGR